MSIQRRTVFFDDFNGIVRFYDWAQVDTTIGSMWEPFMANARSAHDVSVRNFDPTDEIAKVTDLQRMTADMIPNMTGGCIGGPVLGPRVSR